MTSQKKMWLAQTQKPVRHPGRTLSWQEELERGLLWLEQEYRGMRLGWAGPASPPGCQRLATEPDRCSDITTHHRTRAGGPWLGQALCSLPSTPNLP